MKKKIAALKSVGDRDAVLRAVCCEGPLASVRKDRPPAKTAPKWWAARIQACNVLNLDDELADWILCETFYVATIRATNDADAAIEATRLFSRSTAEGPAPIDYDGRPHDMKRLSSVEQVAFCRYIENLTIVHGLTFAEARLGAFNEIRRARAEHRAPRHGIEKFVPMRALMQRISRKLAKDNTFTGGRLRMARDQFGRRYFFYVLKSKDGVPTHALLGRNIEDLAAEHGVMKPGEGSVF